ncbi:MAG: HAD family phosphatase [Jannaschia sp.]
MKAILLGSIGVLADTSAMWRLAFRNAFRDHGLRFGARHKPYVDQLSIFAALRSGSLDDASVPISSLLEARDRHFGRALSTGPVAPRKGLTDLIAAAGQVRVPLGLVATTPMAWTVSVFEALALPPESFDMIVTADHIVAAKPAPDCYHFAAAMLATAPEDCLVIEDNRAGVAAARAAGMQVIDLSPGSPPGRGEPLIEARSRLPQRDLAGIRGA